MQRWLTRAGIVATLLGAAYLLAVLEAQGLIGAWWRILAGLLLGGWLSWLAVRSAQAARGGRAAAELSVSGASTPESPASGSLWAAEALGSLGVAVALLTLTFAARVNGNSALWAALLTLLSLGSVLLARRWGGLATPVVSLSALAVALPLARGVPGEHLWNLDSAALLCMAWALSALALLPLSLLSPALLSPALRQRGWRVAVPGAVSLTLLSVFAALTEIDALSAGLPGEQARLALLVGVLTLAGVLLRPVAAVNPAPGSPDPALRPSSGLEVTLGSVVGTLALATAAGALCRVIGLELSWAVPLAVLAMALLTLLHRARPALVGSEVLRRVTFSAALTAALTATGYGLALHLGEAGGQDWGPALACLGATLLGAQLLTGWRWHGIRAARLLGVLAVCAPLGLLFGPSGVALVPAIWLARRRPPAPAAVLPREDNPLSWESIRAWKPGPLALWGLLALPPLAFGLAGSPQADLGETVLLLLGSAGLLAYSLDGLRRPVLGRLPWVLTALLAWSGSWLLASVLAHGQVVESGNFVLTTPWLALLGGWLLFRAQPDGQRSTGGRGDARWRSALWQSGAALLLFALLRVLVSDLSDSTPLIRAAGLLGSGLVTVLAAIRFPPPIRQVQAAEGQIAEVQAGRGQSGEADD